MSTNDDVVVVITLPDAIDARDPERTAADVAAIEAIDPRVRVTRRSYIEPEAFRTARGVPPWDHLRDQAPELTEEQAAAFAEAEVLLSFDIPLDLLDRAPHLRWVQSIGAGVGALTSSGIPNDRVKLTTGAGNNSVSISEFVMARLLGVWKRFRELDERQAAHEWIGTYGREASRRTIGLVGLGAINSEVAKRADAFGMEVLACRRSHRPGGTAPHVAEVFHTDDLHEMLSRCEVVCSAVPETPETENLFDATAFAAMPEGCVFINVGRGTAVVEADLEAALRSGHLSAACIDVAREEPLPADSPLWEVPNLYISPHSATSTDYYFDNLYELFRDNLRRYLAGEPLRNEAQPGRGY